MKKIFLISIILLAQTTLFAKNVVIFTFYNKEGKNFADASKGVLKSVMQFLKFNSSAKIVENEFDVKGREISEIVKAVPGYDDYCIGYYVKKNNVFEYHIKIFSKNGEILNSFSVSSDDLFYIVDNIVSKISSFYAGKQVSFSTLRIVANLNENKTYTILLNDEILSSITGKTNLSVRIISKVPYSILVRKDETREIVTKKEIILLDNETFDLNLEEEIKKENITPTTNMLDVREKDNITLRKTILPSQVIVNTEKLITSKEILKNEVFLSAKKEVQLALDTDTRIKLYKKYSIPLELTILASVLNVIPGIGSIIIDDKDSLLISLFTPYLTFLLTAYTKADNLNELSTIFGILTILGYGYNLVSPFVYSNFWNSLLRDLFGIPKETITLSPHNLKLSLNLKF